MLLAEQFHENAARCLQMADRARDPLTKAVWERLADDWRRLEREEVEDLDDPFADPEVQARISTLIARSGGVAP
jgi:uncharacterized alpha-E superfamily protein